MAPRTAVAIWAALVCASVEYEREIISVQCVGEGLGEILKGRRQIAALNGEGMESEGADEWLRGSCRKGQWDRFLDLPVNFSKKAKDYGPQIILLFWPVI